MAAKFAKFTGKNNQFCYRLIYTSGEIILNSECFTTVVARDQGIASVKANAGYDERYERSSTPADKWFFSLRASNCKIVGTSPMYETNTEMEAVINAVKAIATNAIIVEEVEIEN